MQERCVLLKRMHTQPCFAKNAEKSWKDLATVQKGGGRRGGKRPELEFLNDSWGRKTGVDLSLPLFFSMPIKCGIFEHTKMGVIGDHPNSGDVTKT